MKTKKELREWEESKVEWSSARKQVCRKREESEKFGPRRWKRKG